MTMVLLSWFGSAIRDPDQSLIGSSPVNVVPGWVSEGNPTLGFKGPERAHPLGTDGTGRDMLAVLTVGTPRTLRVGLVGAFIGLLIGAGLGLIAGYRRGWVDAIVTTVADATLMIPGLAILVVVASYIRDLDVNMLGLIFALFAWPIPARVVRAQVLSMRDRGFIRMARLSNVSSTRIIFGEIMPNLLPFLAALFVELVAGVILASTGVETLGLGPTRYPTLGSTINAALQNSAVFRGIWWWWGLPIVVLIVMFLSLFMLMLSADQWANPRLRTAK